LGLAFRDQWRRLGEAAVKWRIEGCFEPLHIDQSRLALGTRRAEPGDGRDLRLGSAPDCRRQSRQRARRE
jgi:hypothetical protein